MSPTQLLIGIGVMLFLFGSFMYALVINQRKKLQHQKTLDQIREQQQNQLIEAAVRSEEIERHRIAETLHDEVGAILSSSKLHLQAIKATSMDEKDLKLYEKSKMLLDQGIQKVRGISHNLHSNILKEFGLNDAIQHFVTMITKGTLIKGSTELDDTYQSGNPENDISIYRMVQELMNNILKHAEATELNVTSEFSSRQLILTISHNGKGLSQEQFEELRYKKEGLGLKNIQNRVILLKGKIEFTCFENGCEIKMLIPANN